MAEPIRVLHVVGLMSPGGIETLIMNIYRNIDRTKVQFDFIDHKGMEGDFDPEIRRLGGRIYKMPKLRDGDKTYYGKYFEYRFALISFFRNHPEYRVMHCHMTNTAPIYIPIAKKYGNVSCFIAHSHNTQSKPGLMGALTTVFHKFIPRLATDYFACSEAAAQWIYPKKLTDTGRVTIIKNGVDPKVFHYDEKLANSVRQENDLTGRFVVGNVARFKKEKNHVFQVEIFEHIHKEIPNAVLLLIGKGELMAEIERLVKSKGLSDCVRFMGVRNDIPTLMQAMDVFLLPSLFEGLPVVGIEAQAAGLPVFTSTEVTTEMDITGNVVFLDLAIGAEKWAKTIVENMKKFQRKDVTERIRSNGYDITETAAWLQDFYIKKYNEG